MAVDIDLTKGLTDVDKAALAVVADQLAGRYVGPIAAEVQAVVDDIWDRLARRYRHDHPNQ